MSRSHSPRAAIGPYLEILDSRDVPNAVAWTLGANGDFADAAAWTDAADGSHHVPGPTDDATIPAQIMVTSAADETVNSLVATNFQILGGVFGVNNTDPGPQSVLGGLTVGSGATLQVNGGTQPVLISGGTIAGTVNAAPGATIQFNDGATNLNAGGSLTGLGFFRVEGDALTFPTLVLNAPLTAPDHLIVSSGTITGPGTLTVPSGVSFSLSADGAAGATLSGSGAVVIDSGGTMVIGGIGADSITDRTILNSGTVMLGGTGGLTLNDAAVIHNLPGATFQITGDVDVTGVAGSKATPVFINDGVLSKASQSGTGTTNFGVVLNSTGVVRVDSGTLNLTGGGTGSGFLQPAGGTLQLGGGTYTLAAGGNLSGLGPIDITAGTLQFAAGSTFSATGPVNLSGGSLVADADISLPDLNESDGLLAGGGTVTLTGTATWSGGAMSGTGTTVLAPGATLTLTGPFASGGEVLDGSRSFNVGGDIVQSGTGALAISPTATLTIQSGGSYTLSADADITGSGTINNLGTFAKSSTGTGTSTINDAFSNAGTLGVASGSLAFTQNLTQTAGMTAVASGATLQTPTFQLNGGLLGGSGTVNGDVTGGGAIRPGTSALGTGILSINGNVNLTGPLDIGINGTTAGTQYSQLAVNGSVSLSGPLNIVNTFPIPAGRQLVLINNLGTGPVVGTFAGLNEGAKITAGGETFTVSYQGGSGNDVVLTPAITTTSGLVAVGAGPGGEPLVRVFNPDGTTKFSFDAYNPAFRGGVTVALADVNDDGVPDIITAAGPGGGPHIKVFDGTDGATLLASFFAYSPAFTGGVFVAAGDVNGDFHADIITGAGPGGGPNVKAFNGATLGVVADFFPYDPGFLGGVNVG
jgi:fibronectin-binding autotransporter adhesin